MHKNVASQKIGAQMVSATDGSAFTGTVTVYITGDAGTQAIGTVGSGVCTHEGNGFHTYAPSQAETNYDHIAFTFIGSGAVPMTVQVYPDLATADLITALEDGLQAAEVNIGSVVDDNLNVDIYANVDYNSDTTRITFSSTGWPDLSGGEFDEILFGVTINGVVKQPFGNPAPSNEGEATQYVYVTLDHDETRQLIASTDDAAPYLTARTVTYTLFALKGTSRTVLAHGNITVTPTDW